RVELERWDTGAVQIFDRSLKERGADTSISVIWIDQNHSDPREFVFIWNRGRGSHDRSAFFHHEASGRAGGEKSFPVCGGLIPTGDGVEANPARNVLLRHCTKAHEYSRQNESPAYRNRATLVVALSTILSIQILL